MSRAAADDDPDLLWAILASQAVLAIMIAGFHDWPAAVWQRAIIAVLLGGYGALQAVNARRQVRERGSWPLAVVCVTACGVALWIAAAFAGLATGHIDIDLSTRMVRPALPGLVLAGLGQIVLYRRWTTRTARAITEALR